MKFTKTLIASAFALVSLSATAQNEKVETVYEFNPHWYAQVQPLGVQYTLGETDFTDLLSYNLQAGVGYNFTELFGARFSVNAFQSKGAWEIKDKSFNWAWKTVAPMVDGTLNLTNLILDYNPKRLFNVSIFAGIGANIAWDNGEAAATKAEIASFYDNVESNQNLQYLWDGTKVRLMGRAGIMGDFRINDHLNVGLELQAATLSDRYNSKKAGNADWCFNALVGVKYNFGSTYTEKKVSKNDNSINELLRTLRPGESEPARPVSQRPVVDAKEVANAASLEKHIFFTISSSVISEAEYLKVKEIADFLKANPSAKVIITGYADKGTGNAVINKKYAAQRADIVAKTLVEKLGVDKSRIVTDSKGDTEQPYGDANPTLNRVSICITK
ncbi:MAG: OmpA family protein [Bacteroidaceae bacterium]|nr:OmpA family protein [Bacteroidaceae bacterium]